MWSWLVRLWKKLTAPPAPPRPKVRPPIEPLEGRRMLSVVSHAAPSGAGAVPRYDHVVVVVEENHSYSQILGPEVWPPMAFNPIVWSAINQPLPITLDLYTRNLARQSAVMADSHGIAHPSQPNYLALFSGSTQGVNSDGTPKQTFSGPDLAGELIANGVSFGAYSELLPRAGYSGEDVGQYVRHHAPWVNFSDVPAADNLPFSKFPKKFDQLPTVSFVVPNLINDMHSGTVQRGDRWLHDHLSRYARWAKSHNSLLIVTWDEDNGTTANHIPTIFYGAHVVRGEYSQPINHYNVLRTIEEMYGLTPTGNAASAAPIASIFG